MTDPKWASSSLATLVDDVIGGLWGSPPTSANPDETNVLVVRGADFRAWNIRRALDAAPRRIPTRSLERRRLKPGDLVLEVSGGSPAQPVGRVLVIDDRAVSESRAPLICSNFCRKLRLKSGVDPYFVKQQLDWLYWTGHADQFQTSTTNIRNLQVDDFLQGTSIVLPDEPHQAQLVSLLDQADLSRNRSSGHLSAALQAVKLFRQAVLAAAYTEAASVEDNGEVLSALGQLIREPLKNGYSARPVSYPTPHRVLTLTATTSGWFNEKHFKYTDEEFPPDSPFWLTPGDIVIQRGNTAEYVGVPALYTGPPGEFLYPDLMIRARVRTDIDPKFVWYMLLAPQARNYLRDRATGSAGNMPKINQKVLIEVPVPLPSLELRESIVNRLDRAMVLAETAFGHINASLKRVDRSSQAILGKVFRGELIAARTAREPSVAPSSGEVDL